MRWQTRRWFENEKPQILGMGDGGVSDNDALHRLQTQINRR